MKLTVITSVILKNPIAILDTLLNFLFIFLFSNQETKKTKGLLLHDICIENDTSISFSAVVAEKEIKISGCIYYVILADDTKYILALLSSEELYDCLEIGISYSITNYEHDSSTGKIILTKDTIVIFIYIPILYSFIYLHLYTYTYVLSIYISINCNIFSHIFRVMGIFLDNDHLRNIFLKNICYNIKIYKKYI
jgi:hypothetical protein